MTTEVSAVPYANRARNLAARLSSRARTTPVAFGSYRFGGDAARRTTLGEVIDQYGANDLMMVGRTSRDDLPWLAQWYTPTSQWQAGLSEEPPPPIQLPAEVWLPCFLRLPEVWAAVKETHDAQELLKEIDRLPSGVTDWGWTAGQKGEGTPVVQVNGRCVVHRVAHPEVGEVYVRWSPNRMAYITSGTTEQLAALGAK